MKDAVTVISGTAPRQKVLPRWGGKNAAGINPPEIEKWLEALTYRPQVKKDAPLSWGLRSTRNRK